MTENGVFADVIFLAKSRLAGPGGQRQLDLGPCNVAADKALTFDSGCDFQRASDVRCDMVRRCAAKMN
jgi:hypothetical protein